MEKQPLEHVVLLDGDAAGWVPADIKTVKIIAGKAPMAEPTMPSLTMVDTHSPLLIDLENTCYYQNPKKQLSGKEKRRIRRASARKK